MGLCPAIDLSSPSADQVKPWQPVWLAKTRFGAHVCKMEKFRARLLDVTVKPDRPPRWEWQVTSNGEMIANGFEDGQIEARFEGYNAMFLLLAAGWGHS